MHPAAVDPKYRLRHKRRMQLVVGRNFPDHEFIYLCEIGHYQPFLILQVDFLLARSYLVMRGFHRDSHLLQGQDGHLLDLGPDIAESVIEIAPFVNHFRLFRTVEIEIFQFRPDIERPPLLGGLFQLPFKDIPRIPFIRSPVRVLDIAEHHGGFHPVDIPRDNPERPQIRDSNQVRFFDPDKSFNRGPVKALTVFQNAFYFRT